MREWFEGLSDRERWLLIIGGVALVFTLLFTQLWLPMAEGIKAAKAEQIQHKELLGWMRQQAPKLQALQQSGGSSAPAELAEGQLLVVADRSAKQAGLASAIKRTNPESDGGVRVVLEDANFNDLLGWLAKLYRQHGVEVANLTTTAKDAPGIVDARVSLKGAGQ